MQRFVHRLGIRKFRPVDLVAAAGLLASSHSRAQAIGPAGLRLGERFTESAGCRGLIEQLSMSPRASAIIAEDDDRILGYLIGEKQLFAPEDFASIYAEPRSTNVPLHGHAVAVDCDAAAVYEAMYSALAEPWVADGFFVHNIAVNAFDRAAMDSWVNLGFGRKSVCAVRPTMRLDSDHAQHANIVIEEIRGHDDEALEIFHRRLMAYQTAAPMFWPYTGESDVRVSAVRRDAMVSGQGFAYLARTRAGEAVGSLLFVPSIFLSPLMICEKMVYLWEGFVDDSYRARGVGSMLLEHAMAALFERGVEWCALHFVSGNPRGGPFWTSKGFLPVEAVMHRHVDERVAWARGVHA